MKNFKGFTAGVLCGAIVMGAVPTIAKVGKEAIDVVYNNIKLEVNGIKTTMPKGVEPFMYNGTTYLPVRAVAEALGEKVEYDKSKATVYVGSRTEKMNDGSIDFYDFVEKVKPLEYDWGGGVYATRTLSGNSYITIAGERVGFENALYSKKPSSVSSIGGTKYMLGGNYKAIKGKIALPDEYNAQKGKVIIRDGDNNVIYEKGIDVNKDGKIVDFYADVVGHQTVRIEIENNDCVLLDVYLEPLK